MAQAIYHSNRGEKSALILLKANEFEFSSTPVYVPREAVKGKTPKINAEGEENEEFDTFNIPDGYKLVDMVDPDTGDVRTTKEGEPLKMLKY